MKSVVELKELKEDYVKELSDLLLSVPANYSQHFIPFDYDVSTISGILRRKTDDLYMGIFTDAKIQGFFMLRGFDDGYDIPSYGVWISPQVSKNGIGRLTLEYVFSYCRLNKIEKVMLKVHPKNIYAKMLYERVGFSHSSIDEKGYYVYYKEIVL